MNASGTPRRPHRVTRKQQFLHQMDSILPWGELIELIRPWYYKGERGRPPLGIEKMLRVYLLQCWFSLSDIGVEEALLDSRAMAEFARLDPTVENVPDSTTLAKFRHLLGKHELASRIFDFIVAKLGERGLIMQGGTIVDATLLAAPSSTKNAAGERDPEMSQTKKGNQYYFGMKAHIGVCAATGYVHTVKTTAANTHDVVMAGELLRDDDHILYGDAGYIGVEKRPEMQERSRKQAMSFQINRRRGSVQKVPAHFFNWEKSIERRKSSVRSKVEHPFRIVKCLFGYTKTVYRGIKKNTDRLLLLFASANLLMCAQSGRVNGSL